MGDAVFVGGVVTLDEVELALCQLARLDSFWAKFGNIIARHDITVDVVVYLEEARLYDTKGPEKVPCHVIAGVIRSIEEGTGAEAEGGKEGGGPEYMLMRIHVRKRQRRHMVKNLYASTRSVVVDKGRMRCCPNICGVRHVTANPKTHAEFTPTSGNPCLKISLAELVMVELFRS